MRTGTLALAAALSLSLAGTALAQTAAGSAEQTLNNPASVKSNSEKAMERSGGNPSQDTTGAIGHPKSHNSVGGTGSEAPAGAGAPAAPAAR